MTKYIRRTMRCKIEKLSDEAAAAVVKEGKAEYVLKDDWERQEAIKNDSCD